MNCIHNETQIPLNSTPGSAWSDLCLPLWLSVSLLSQWLQMPQIRQTFVVLYIFANATPSTFKFHSLIPFFCLTFTSLWLGDSLLSSWTWSFPIHSGLGDISRKQQETAYTKGLIWGEFNIGIIYKGIDMTRKPTKDSKTSNS